MSEAVRKNWLNGQLKFSPNVSYNDVLALAKEFKEGSEGDKIKALAVRSCGEREFGIIFAFEYDGEEMTRKSLMYKLTDKLKRRFGNDVNWDISGTCLIIE